MARRMDHELRNRQQRARDSLREEREEMNRELRLLRATWKELTTFRASRGSYREEQRRRRPLARKAGSRKRARTMRFPGTRASLKALLRPLKLAGSWTARPHGVWTLRCCDGAILNWAETRGTLWFQGPESVSRKLERRVQKRLRAWYRRQSRSSEKGGAD